MFYKFPNYKEFTNTEYKFNSRVAFILEALESLPVELVLGRLMRFVSSNSFDNYKKELGELNESMKDFSINLPMPNFKQFNSTLYNTNLKLMYLFESFNYIPIDKSLTSFIMSIDDLSFKDYKNDINSLVESLEIITEKKREGRGGLKQLVGKKVSDELTAEDAVTIGNMIAEMSGEKKKNFIGVVNYLGSTCTIFHEIKNSYLKEVRREVNNQTQTEEFKPKRPENNSDTLKFLVGKSGQERIEPSEGAEIGRLISRMEDVNRRDYVGMVNFLGASCRIHHDILTAYYAATEKQDKPEQAQLQQQIQPQVQPQIQQQENTIHTKKPKEVQTFTRRMRTDSDYKAKTNERILKGMKEKGL